MKKSFAAGAIAGISSLALAVPLLAQVSNAAGTSSSAATTNTRPAPTQACVSALAAADAARLATIDAVNAATKAALQAHQAALAAAAGITDDTAREAAVRKAEDDLHTAMKAAMGTSDQTQMDAVKTACGNSFHGGPQGGMFGEKMGGKGPMEDMLAQKLGMTADELKTELDSGKTIEQIATEKGVTLPARPTGQQGGMRFGRRGGPGMGGFMQNQMGNASFGTNAVAQ